MSILVTKPSPEAPTGPTLTSENSTLVHVLVHRESEEYKNDEEEVSPSPSGEIVSFVRIRYFLR